MKYFSLLFAHSPFLPLRSLPMKPRFSLLAAAAVSLVFCAPANAADLTWTYSPSKTATGAQTINGITITPSYVWKVDESFSAYSGGVQIGKTEHNVISITYDFSAFPSDIKSVAITGKSGAENSGKNTVSATIGLEPFTGSAALTSSEGTLTLTAPEGTQTGNLSILIDNPRGDEANSKSQAIYIKSIVVTYKDPSAAGLTQLGTPDNLLAPSTNYFGFALSWDPVTHATNGYTVTLSPADGNSGVTVSGTTATMTGLTEGATYDVSVVAKGDGTGTDDSEAAELRGVTTLTAPPVSQPDLSYTVSASSLTVLWSAQNDADFSVLAWTNKPVNAASQDFAGYAANGTVPDGWTFNNSHGHYSNTNAPVDFKDNGNWIASPEFGGPIESVSFYIAAVNTVTNSHFFVYGTTGTTDREDWILLNEVTDSETGTFTTGQKTLSVSPSAGIKRIIFEYQKNQGNVRIGTFSVTGTGVGKEPVYLPGYGPSPTDVNTTSVTFANPVVGETYYVEVTATGRSGRTESKTISVPIPAPRHGSVISVK